MKRATAKEVVPTKPGTPFAGGIYMGRYFDGTEARALIVAARAEGELEAAPHADALKQAKACRIAGHKDWKVPTRLQALTLWNNRKALKENEAFPEEWHWTAELYERVAGCAWCQSFDGGVQYADYRGSHLRVRFVRSVVI